MAIDVATASRLTVAGAEQGGGHPSPAIPAASRAEGEQADRSGRPEADREKLALARACPWANRAIFVGRPLGLEPRLFMAIAGPTYDERSW